MSRANDDTQVDYSLLDDRALGDAVAEKVLMCRWRWQAWYLPEDTEALGCDGGYPEITNPEAIVSWWGAGLVIDTLRAEGYTIDIGDWGDVVSATVWSGSIGPRLGDADHPSPIRAILIAALRAKEAE